MQRLTAISTLLALVSLSFSPLAQAQRAASAYVPPAPDAAVRKAAVYPQPEETVAGWLKGGYPAFVYGDFAGRNAALAKAAAEKGVALEVAVNMPVDLAGAGFFGAPRFDGVAYVFAGAVESLDATAIRLQVDLAGLDEGDELYVVAPDVNRPFGPYTAADAVDGGRWLPTIFGESAVLVVRSAKSDFPALRILAYAHFYHDFLGERAKATEFDCPVNVACVTETGYQNATSAVGLLIIPVGGGQGLCSGSLLNNPYTLPLEPYFLTANHCFGTRPAVANIEVKWDYRAANCDGTGVPSLNSVPASDGKTYLAHSDPYDGEFIELDSVPTGDYGRMYLGWDIDARSVGEHVAGIHHPAGEPMKGAFGDITAIHVDTFLGNNQNRVQWDDGITKGGSSGSPLLLRDEDFVVVGMLSSGTLHNCLTPEANTDNYASFRDFYPDIECYIAGDIDAPAGVQASDGTSVAYVQVTWQAVDCAQEYRVYRSDDSNSANAVPVSPWLDASLLEYNDTTAAPAQQVQTSCCAPAEYTFTTHTYWVRARLSRVESALSDSDTGYRGASKSAAAGMGLLAALVLGGIIFLDRRAKHVSRAV